MTDAPRSAPTRPGGPVLPVYRAVLALFLLAGVVQIFLAGFGTFHGGFAAHRALGFGMAGLAVVILVLALVTRAGTRDVVLALVLVLLAGGAQSLLADARESGAFWGG